MAKRRGFFRTRVVRVYRRARKHASRGLFGRAEGWLNSMAARPSKPIAAALTISGLLYLIFAPLPNGDGWVPRLQSGMASYKVSQDAGDLLATDAVGNNIFSIASMQIANNVMGAAVPLTGAVIVRLLGKKFGF